MNCAHGDGYGRAKKFLELTEKALAVLTRVSFLLGGAILLIYCGRYGGFPDGLTISDTLRIFLTVTVFSAGTLVTYFFLMCLGVSLWYMLFRLSRLKCITGGFNWLEGLMREARRKKWFCCTDVRNSAGTTSARAQSSITTNFLYLLQCFI